MGLISPTIPTVGSARGDEEVDVRSAIIALLNEFNGNIDNANIKAAANIDGAKLLQPAWQLITMSGMTPDMAYYKDPVGVVHFRGDLLNAPGGYGALAALGTLPAGYRPGTLQSFPVSIRGVAVDSYTMRISATGAMTTGQAWPAGATITFGSLNFRAEN